MYTNPNLLLRALEGGKTSVIAALIFGFTAGYAFGKGEGRKYADEHWKRTARSGDAHWHKEHGYHTGKYTEREHDRDNHRKYGGQHER